ncbi:hypothetical protein [Baekduia sp. Peel2402]|uniref:hypothetical protein n=1 Tax=Baekduia sp. Peel2402 TaxID=3458296 RepID=UPI00403EE2AF
MRRRFVLLAIALLAAVAVVPAARAAAAVTATPLTAVGETPIAVYGGWVVWSEPGADGLYRVVAYHDGVKRTLNQIAPRTVPFDLDAGPDSRDRPAIVFSRCTTERDVHAMSAWATARGCRLRQATLDGAAESGLPTPGRGSASDSVPSRWGYRVAFQRRARNSDVSQLMLYDMQHNRIKKLPHGALPHHCPYRTGCKNPRYMGEFGELDLGARDVAYSWHLSAPAVTGVGFGTELRVVATATGRSLLAGSGYVSGACGGRSNLAPQATPGGVLFVSLQFFCEAAQGTVTATSFGAGGLLSQTTNVGGGVAYRVLRDAADGTMYAVLGPAHVDFNAKSAPMTLVRLSSFKLTKTDKVANEPFDTGL